MCDLHVHDGVGMSRLDVIPPSSLLPPAQGGPLPLLLAPTVRFTKTFYCAYGIPNGGFLFRHVLVIGFALRPSSMYSRLQCGGCHSVTCARLQDPGLVEGLAVAILLLGEHRPSHQGRPHVLPARGGLLRVAYCVRLSLLTSPSSLRPPPSRGCFYSSTPTPVHLSRLGTP